MTLEKVILKIKKLIKKLFGNEPKKTHPYKYWTEGEVALFTHHSDSYIAEQTGRSAGSVRAKRCRLNRNP